MTGSWRRAAVLATASLVVLAACGQGPATGGSTADEPVPGRSAGDVSGEEVSVLLPTGRIDLTVGEPVEGSIDGDLAADDETHDAPDRGSFVPVSWSHDPFGLEQGAALMSTAPRPAEVTVVVDGERHGLGSPYEVVSEQAVADTGVDVFYVPVGSVPEASDITVEVAYDGQTQSVTATGERDAGVAAALYEESEVGLGPICPARDESDPTGFAFELRCAVGPGQTVPYLPDRGWAEEDHAFLVVGYDISLDDVTYSPGGGGEATYDVVRTTAALTLDGQDPLGSMPELGEAGNEEGDVSDFAVFDTTLDAERSLGVDLSYHLAIDDLGGVADAPTTLDLSRVVDLG